jgi:hypothetical protein
LKKPAANAAGFFMQLLTATRFIISFLFYYCLFSRHASDGSVYKKIIAVHRPGGKRTGKEIQP